MLGVWVVAVGLQIAVVLVVVIAVVVVPVVVALVVVAVAAVVLVNATGSAPLQMVWSAAIAPADRLLTVTCWLVDAQVPYVGSVTVTL